MAALPETVRRTLLAVRATAGHEGARGVAALASGAYLLTYLWAIDKLHFERTGFAVTVARDPLGTFFRQSFGTFTYEPVVLLRFGFGTYQFSLNTLMGLGIAVLVGISLGVSYLAWRQPASCGIGSQSAGLFAGIPALLSGTACCAPVIFLVLGVQITGAMLTAFEFLLPIALVLLVGSLLVVGRQVDPTLLEEGT